MAADGHDVFSLLYSLQNLDVPVVNDSLLYDAWGVTEGILLLDEHDGAIVERLYGSLGDGNGVEPMSDLDFSPAERMGVHTALRLT